ncbi:MAG TPA: TrmH family RNA methyltransferase [Candidatus Limnocylindria bacterium]|nr:TrmH family RNA methyltransferase [Candidatus Limnocylindria bacterium]
MRKIVLIAHNLRSCHNVGSLLRTAEGSGVGKVFLTGYTPYPMAKVESRLPHESRKIHRQISKTALGAEEMLDWAQAEDVFEVIRALRQEGFAVYALEQTAGSIKLPEFTPPERMALLVGREVEGVEPEVLAVCDGVLEIPMFGQKESFNVVQAAAMALYQCTFF